MADVQETSNESKTDVQGSSGGSGSKDLSK